ncbi:MAG: SAM-dependent methyltransferase [Bacteroidota bacterium]
MEKPALYLIPCRIAEGNPDRFFSAMWKEDIRHLRQFLAEDVRTARQFLSALKVFGDIGELSFAVLSRETPVESVEALMQPLKDGLDLGVLSESGCPGIADPGALAVAWAHRHGYRVKPLVGPSSIVLALMASGFNGQQFTFNGYLPIGQQELTGAIRKLERQSKETGAAQIFIESPHRNQRLLETLLKTLSPASRLCVAQDLTGEGETIISREVSAWPQVNLPKLPCIFLFQA